jgi:thiosulfate/3-mercaptopyruvate sulfurtransferase
MDSEMGARDEAQPHVFIVRLWWEADQGGHAGEWRGWIEHTATRERRYFRQSEHVARFIERCLDWQPRPPPIVAADSTATTVPERRHPMQTPNGYARPDALVDTQWVADHGHDPHVRLVEVDVDTTAYGTGHVPGAVGWNWQIDLQRRPMRDIPTKAEWEALLSRSGIANDTTVVLYGDNNNWFAAFALWLFKLYGHQDVRLMNGSRSKWIAEDRELTQEVPRPAATTYHAREADPTLRAFRDDVAATIGRADRGLVDVRSPKEYSGELLAPENLPQEGAQRGGHVPGARNIPWATAVASDGSFKPVADLLAIYGDNSISADKPIIAYCRIGERSAHTWFVLSHLLGYPDVRNYDGSWTEWGSLIGAPIEV